MHKGKRTPGGFGGLMLSRRHVCRITRRHAECSDVYYCVYLYVDDFPVEILEEVTNSTALERCLCTFPANTSHCQRPTFPSLPTRTPLSAPQPFPRHHEKHYAPRNLNPSCWTRPANSPCRRQPSSGRP